MAAKTISVIITTILIAAVVCAVIMTVVESELLDLTSLWVISAAIILSILTLANLIFGLTIKGVYRWCYKKTNDLILGYFISSNDKSNVQRKEKIID